MKRQRGRGRKPGQQNPNRAYESAGPDVKVRGSAQTVFEKYQQLGRDANSSGDRVLAENYLQHAEHYFRLLKAMQPTFVPRSELVIAGFGADDDWDDEDGEEAEGGEAAEGDAGDGQPQGQFQGQRREFRDPRGPRPEARGDNRGENRPDGREDGDEVDGFGRRRNRRRRDRFRPDGAPEGENGAMRGENGDRGPRREIREGEQAGGAPASFALRRFAPQPELGAAAGEDGGRGDALRVQQLDPTPLPESGEPKPRRERGPRRPRGGDEGGSAFGGEVPAFLAPAGAGDVGDD